MRDVTTGPSEAQLVNVIGCAARAPSIYNTQPWLFRPLATGVEVYADRSRQLQVSDPTGRSLRVSCGAAVFNLRLALTQLGWATEVSLLPDRSMPDLLARVRATRPKPATPEEERLFEAIPRRRSNRAPFLDTAVSLDAMAALRAAATAEGCWLDLLISPAALAMAAQLIRAADNVLLRNDAYQAELAAWSHRPSSSPDGVSTQAAGPTPDSTDLLARRDFGGPTRGPGREYETEPVVGVLGGSADTPRDEIAVGQALQRVLLSATTHGLVASLMSQPIDVPQVREQLRIGLRRHGLPQMVFRVGYGTPACPSARRSVEDLIVTEAPVPSRPPQPTRPAVPIGPDR